MKIYLVCGSEAYSTEEATTLVKSGYLTWREEDKDKCPHCSKPIEIQHDIVEGCLNWQTETEPVETLPNKAIKNN